MTVERHETMCPLQTVQLLEGNTKIHRECNHHSGISVGALVVGVFGCLALFLSVEGGDGVVAGGAEEPKLNRRTS